MPLARNIFVGGLDSDTAKENLPANKATALRNVVLERGAVETAWGNVRLNPSDFINDEADTRCVGTATDSATGLVYGLLWRSTADHRLVRLDPRTGTYTSLVAWEGLKVPETPTKQVAFLDGLLLWLDTAGELRELPVDRAATFTPAFLEANPLALHVVKQPPLQAPVATRETNTDATDPRSTINVVGGSAWQFAFQYEYVSGERTPLGPYSEVLAAAPSYSLSDLPDPRNFIRVAYPAGHLGPPALVQAVRLLVREQGAPAWQVAGEFAGSSAFDFYGTTTGEVIADAAKLSEAFPVAARALAVARSRVFVGDCTEGYATTVAPAQLTTTVETVDATPGTPQELTVWQTNTEFKNTYYEQDGTERYTTETRTRYFALRSGSYPDPDSVYYEVQTNGTDYYPAPGNALFTYRQAFEDYQNDEAELAYREVTELTIPLGTTPASFADSTTFHQRSAYPVGVAFYDAWGRTAGAEAVRNVQIPALDYQSPAPRFVQWSLAATPPAWARSYSLLLGQNRTLSYFLQVETDQLRQYRGEKADGSGADLRPIREDGFAFVKQVWVSLTALLASGRGYSFQQGDYLRFPAITTGQTDYPILGMRGEYVQLSAAALNLFNGPFGEDLNTETPLVELYRPATTATVPVLYERGPRYPVLNPGTPSARLSVTSGTLAGDTTLQLAATGNQPVLEHMNPTVRQYGLWLDASRGRAIPVLPDAAQVRRKALVRFSGVKVQGTRLNGLSVWDSASQHDCPQEQGAIQALVLAAQTQSEGSVLLAVQEAGSQSLYLGEAPLQLAGSGQLNAVADRVIGAGNDLRGGYGTRHPATVTGWQGRVYWYDEAHGEVLRYAANGATPLAEKYQGVHRLRELAAAYAGQPLHGAYDPGTEAYYLFFPARGVLPGVALVFSERAEAFADLWDLPAEYATAAADRLLDFYQGKPWLHQPEAPRLSFFGQARRMAAVTTCLNEASELTKTWQQVALSGPERWNLAVTNDLGQASRILPKWWADDKGIWRSAFRRDEKTPGVQAPLVQGRELQSPTLDVTLTYSGSEAARLVSLDVGYYVNPGQQPPA